jgi:hypothetical protein
VPTAHDLRRLFVPVTLGWSHKANAAVTMLMVVPSDEGAMIETNVWAGYK